MSISKVATIAGATVVLAATAAFAMTKMSDREAIYIAPNGSHKVVTATDKGHTALMSEARALEAGAIVYRSGGKLYVLEDRKMPNGKMMFDAQENWFKQAVGNSGS